MLQKPKGRPLNLTTEQHQSLLNDLVEGRLNNYAISKKYGIHPSTVTHIKQRSYVQIEEHKKTVSQQLGNGFTENLSAFGNRAGTAILSALGEITPEKLKKCSAPQLATVCGILFDKIQTLEKSLGERSTSVRWETRKEMVAFIQTEAQTEPGPSCSVGRAVLDTEAAPAPADAGQLLPLENPGQHPPATDEEPQKNCIISPAPGSGPLAAEDTAEEE